MHKLHPRTLLLALAASAALAACGSGDHELVPVGTTGNGNGSGTAAGTDVPQSAQDSVAGLLAYVTQLIGSMTNDTGEPVLLGNATLPTSDTTEATP